MRRSLTIFGLVLVVALSTLLLKLTNPLGDLALNLGEWAAARLRRLGVDVDEAPPRD